MCWMAQPSDHPNIRDVLQCLERDWKSLKPPCFVDEAVAAEEDKTMATEDDEMLTTKEDEVLTTEEDTNNLNFTNYSPGKFSHFIYYKAS